MKIIDSTCINLQILKDFNFKATSNHNFSISFHMSLDRPSNLMGAILVSKGVLKCPYFGSKEYIPIQLLHQI